jgi:glutamate N-acetyltransferase/amino-acid N-acetyltransferase
MTNMSSIISPLAPKMTPHLPAIAGVRLATAQAGIRYRDRTDVMLAVFEPQTSVAGVFTRSKCPSAPVEWCRTQIKGGNARALVVNSGNANAFTGKSGRQACALTAKFAAAAVGCKSSEVFLASTGVIGEPLDARAFDRVMTGLVADVRPDGYGDAAKAIMTTDTFPKLATARARLRGTDVTINGFAKGAGMIAPDMATLLAFVFTDAPISAPVLQAVLREGVTDTFNAVTIDGDTSTSDTVLAFATGAAAAPRISRSSEMAVGKAGEPANRDRLSIWFGGIRVAHKGARDQDYDEAAVSAAMKRPEISLKVALGLGKGRDRVLTCDLTEEYVAINGDYRS